ncbi:MAG TPA: transglutaminase-like cysteine peptidase [Methylocystis sp.]|nr:transglutaminase-like cysteine peptidase [Methylocystis sp.]
MLGVARNTALALTLAGVALLSSNVAGAAEASLAAFAATGAETTVPYGWVDFCARYEGECPDDMRAAQPVELTPQVMRRIRSVNAQVNHAIEPVSDMDHWGVIDQWDYPSDGKGDCEDFALLKRRMLMKAGFPRQALLMTVVKEKNGDGHALLMVRTTGGDLVLDNLADDVKLWRDAPYRFVKRQSEANPNIWVSIGAPTNAPEYVSK